MKHYETQIEIQAKPSQVWQILTEQMPRTPAPYGIVKLDGRIALGAKIKLWSEVIPERAFSLHVSQFVRDKFMEWRGGMPLGLFVGTRTFTITATENGCSFQMREVFSGPLSGLITKSMPDLTPSFVKFASMLKQKAEEK